MKLAQFKYTTNSSASELEGWISGSIFRTVQSNSFSVFPAYRLRIQGMSGIKFNINNSFSWCTLGYDGVYELDLGSSQPLITNLRFARTSLENLPSNVEILVEIFYEGGFA